MIRIFCKKEPPEFGKKQPPEVFYKKSCSEKFCNFHRKTPKLESLSNKGADQKEKTKKRFQHVFSCEYCQIFKDTNCIKHL